MIEASRTWICTRLNHAKLLTTLSSSIDGASKVDSTLEKLYKEIKSISIIYESIAEAWGSTTGGDLHPADLVGNLSKSVTASIDDITDTLSSLNVKISRIQKPTWSPFGQEILRKPILKWRLDSEMKKLQAHREGLQTFMLTMQSALLMRMTV